LKGIALDISTEVKTQGYSHPIIIMLPAFSTRRVACNPVVTIRCLPSATEVMIAEIDQKLESTGAPAAPASSNCSFKLLAYERML
jgi:hypothetical protein